jgi:predicted ATPase
MRRSPTSLGVPRDKPIVSHSIGLSIGSAHRFRDEHVEQIRCWEESFLKAIEIARRQRAKSLELRAVMSLSRLWKGQGKKDDARQMLATIYAWFTEGHDTPDLQEADTLLQELA